MGAQKTATEAHLMGGAVEPLGGFGQVALDAAAARVHHAEVALGQRVALLRGQGPPAVRL